MRVLIKIRRSPVEQFLIHLPKRAIIEEMKDLVRKRNIKKAISIALTEGIFIRKVHDHELMDTRADMILTEHNAYIDLT